MSWQSVFQVETAGFVKDAPVGGVGCLERGVNEVEFAEYGFVSFGPCGGVAEGVRFEGFRVVQLVIGGAGGELGEADR
ncbi:hypothetical protein F6X56_02085 (plasmid) [Rhodococcus erythropolis]|uniref:hypothetical protein n=1 Tax=Rhodococcus TaxID=1827 RepID=UPI0012466C57|nr:MULTISPECIES: hypothetical protein [Rhodococcus]MCJ0950606.1 hypothetical protein [Rhodococcus sp. ARC_M8]MCQ4152567.1 hypothetical protein [Rhodococcus qingshengii]QEX08539.1 hypothetical protein F6X56_02085 [Rhodococcus erythropolis]